MRELKLLHFTLKITARKDIEIYEGKRINSRINEL